jgi:hypothetical protein
VPPRCQMPSWRELNPRGRRPSDHACTERLVMSGSSGGRPRSCLTPDRRISRAHDRRAVTAGKRSTSAWSGNPCVGRVGPAPPAWPSSTPIRATAKSWATCRLKPCSRSFGAGDT